MKIRSDFVTNSSSTNFMIISKEELTTDYLMKKLGIKKGSKFKNIGYSLACDIINATSSGVRWYDVKQIDYDTILEIFGEDSAKKYKKLSAKGYHTYIGYTSTDESYTTAYLTTDYFIIDQKDFYMDGRNCAW